MKPKVEEDSLDLGKEKVQGDSDQEMMNLENELYSLTHYADDEEELVAQMFATIKGSKLEAMMPPILKEIPLIDVQQLCLHELRGMSQRRILSIINGQEMSGSSSDEDSDENKKTSKLQDENEDSNLGLRSLDEGGDVDNPNENLTAMDILELEMRAKLIKTMLEKQDGDGSTPDIFDPNIKIKEEPLSSDCGRNRDGFRSTKSRRRKRYSRRRRSGSSSYSSSRSSSRSRSTSYSSERKKEGSESPESKKPSKKKITKKEFVARMKKAKQNRSYRKRKDSEEDSEEKLKKGKGKKKKEKEDEETTSNELTHTPIEESFPPDQDNIEKGKKVEDNEEGEGDGEENDEEGEVGEREEGELDSNEEGAYSSRSRSYSSSYSSYNSSRSRSYSSSPRRRRKKKSKRKSRKSHRKNRSRSPSVSDKPTPKVPNWPGAEAVAELILDNTENASSEMAVEEVKLEDKTLGGREDRKSISFSINKKTTIKTNPDLNDEAMPDQISVNTNKHTNKSFRDSGMENNDHSDRENALVQGITNVEENQTKSNVNEMNVKPESYSIISTADASNKLNEKKEGDVEITEDFYKGADQLDFSEEEGECDDEALEKFLHDDTPVEQITIEDETAKKMQKECLLKEESMEWDGKKDSLTGEVAVPSTLQDLNATQKEELLEDTSLGESLLDVGEECSQEALERLPESEISQEAHSLDIIGVIDPKQSEATQESYDELGGGSSSWSMRWLQSEKVQKVVSNSKMLSKVRKNIQAKGKDMVKVKPSAAVVKTTVVEVKPEIPKVESKPVKKTTGGVIGSIDEYEKLFGIKVKAPTSLPQPKAVAKPATAQATSQPMSLLDSDEDEDSEEEALWSKIIKK